MDGDQATRLVQSLCREALKIYAEGKVANSGTLIDKARRRVKLSEEQAYKTCWQCWRRLYPDNSMPVFSIEHLRQVGAAIFAAAGAPPAAADVVAKLLADANAVGHDSHGVIRIPQYITTIEKGEIVPHAEVEVVRQTAAAAVLDGHWGFGQVVMNQAVEMGLERAGNCGVAAITVKNANHIGRLGSYVEHIAEANMIGLLCANSHGAGAGVAPWGGIAGRLGTNPLAGGWPDGEGGALVLDITTSVVAEGKVRVKRNRGEPVPEGWIIDAAGQPSTESRRTFTTSRAAVSCPLAASWATRATDSGSWWSCWAGR